MTTDTITEPLTINQVLILAKIVEAWSNEKTVAWIDQEVSSDIQFGTMRHAYPATGQDVRSVVLRITTDKGFEQFLPIAHAINLVRCGLMTFDYKKG